MGSGTVNRHRGLRDGDLPRRYLRRHERGGMRDVAESVDLDWYDWVHDVDDWWQPYGEGTAVDFELQCVWQDVLSAGFAPWLDVRRAQASEPELPSPQPDAGMVSGDDFASALHQHFQLITSNTGRATYLASGPFVAARGQLRACVKRSPALLGWFSARQGPGVMVFLLAPYWIRSLEAWSAPDARDPDVIGRSLIDHLLVRHVVPEALYWPWRSAAFPSLKWVSWLLLISRGASVPRTGDRFGWAVSSKLLAHVQSAPPDLTPVEALIRGEVLRAGGSPLEFDRLRPHRGYLFDPTVRRGGPELRFEDERPEDGEHTARTQQFLQATVDWLVRHRAELADDLYRGLILDWALHRHTEDLARDVPDRARFSWRGRTPASALDEAREYGRGIRRAGWPSLRWRPRGWDWELRDDGGVWTVRELTTSTELAEESVAMSHCVVSYVYRCAQGFSAIFSLSFDQVRRVTIEVEPRSRRIVQCRGNRNRSAEPREIDIVQRWLTSLGDASR